MSTKNNCPFSAEEIASEGIKPEEYEEIVRRLGRHPNKAELGMFGVMWSEHCCYKNSRPLLKQFPTTGERILVGPGENAGVVDFGDGLHIAFKIESHNHPSAIEPFQGAATGVGGILRDIFTMGARPIAALNSLRFGSLEDNRTRQIFKGVVSGISHYGNCFGVPTVGGEVYFDPAYNGNPLVNAMAIGLMETPEIVKSGASGIGNPVLYVGSTTGRDGMGGASFASAELSEESIQDRPAVQVGDPFLEKSLVEACLEAFKTGAVVAAQDMGAAGITCSTSEMAAKGGVGIELDLDLIPVRETGMVAYEYLLSESQERMLFVAQKGREQELIDIFHRWGLQAVVAGTVIAEPIVRILFQGEIAAEIPADALAENTPLYPREILSEPPEYVQIAWQWKPENLPESTISGIKIKGEFQSWNQVLLTLLDTPSIASKRWVYRQYDHQVQNNTVLVPGGGDAAVIRLRPLEPPQPPLTKGGLEDEDPASLLDKGGLEDPASPLGKGGLRGVYRGLAATVDCNSRYVYLDPYEGAKATVAEAARNLSCVGAEPIAVTDNLNFGSPEKPIGYWQLAESCRGISDGCKALNTPVTGGNVSLYNETLDAEGNPESIYPTPVVGMVGLITDLTKVCGQGWQSSGDLIYLLGDDKTLPTLGASEYLAVLHSTIAGKPPRVDFELEQKVQTACREGIRQGWIKSAHDCAEGGLAVALAESCLSGQKGATVKLGLGSNPSVRWDNILFGEGGGQILVSVHPESQLVWEGFLEQQLGKENDIWQNFGFVGSGSEPLRILADDQGLIEVDLGEMGDRYFNAIERRVDGQD
ncbi:Phosphoribosylformylglycinamidine synthase 2 [Planktothrix rubescens CCAP 1459/22]|uniref:Phosphoribosylformylglycinamidine synthase subunit PurL n=4 Tax=Planktothrix TaxID=54304 RepID=A0A6J7ZLG2_PLARU|nr:phosphoribosylformylglycinamidine synthase subunit PurL [Planktothrix rubescens]CAC5343673.1 Phosphoribosylformylglycinamidine synthase 2 [Planktothrix rubescens NIVA-CYA 18]CAD5980433.1 Phosphoribosylformylglycinamidine synthase subunit PurL [Planktothrix rubescens NIVA-CYA 18]